MTKQVDFDTLWAEYIYKKRFEGKDYLFAYARKYHDYDDVIMDGEGKWIGIEEMKIPRMVVDTDENSPTAGKRVPKTNKVEHQDGSISEIPDVIGTRYGFLFEDNEKNREKFKKMARDTLHGSTRFVWCLQSRNYTCAYPEEFWTSEIKDVESQIARSRSIYAKPAEN